MTVQHRRGGLPLLAVALAVFAWGFGPLFVKGIDASAPTIVLWRVTIGTAIAVAFAYLMGGRITLRLVVVAFPAACASRSASCSGSRRSRRRRSSTPRSSRPCNRCSSCCWRRGCSASGGRGSSSRTPRSRWPASWWSSRARAPTARRFEGNIFAVANLLVFTGYFLLGKRARDADVHAWSFLAAVFLGACVIVVPWSLDRRRTISVRSRAPTGCSCSA